ncbi:hypothetical protein HanXRQr2_Chr15g0715011 [Helianthus annuus]|uniref:Uncharacterized protein n=1 Tax=Helianthus annuus TaxID=4232 RepID=A0A9K3H4U7_HELAN|nr:hypothetical protein HanXRQr2_Chr15g0715011 [Helianthus annuus]
MMQATNREKNPHININGSVSNERLLNLNTWKYWLCSGTTLTFSTTTVGLPAISK